MLTNLRTFGYVFNPVSFFYCYRRGRRSRLRVVAEVSNTFGERHPYLLTTDNQVSDGARHVYAHDKALHVSPFFGMDQTYRFSFTEPGERVHAAGRPHRGRRRGPSRDAAHRAPAPSPTRRSRARCCATRSCRSRSSA